MTQPAIIARGLGKRFGERAAFEELTFDVDAAEVFGFLGPNGAGKTTTVRVLGTLLAPTSGTAEVAGSRCCPRTAPSSGRGSPSCRSRRASI
jgi:ABC-2 type transport system ATP-binding protein